MKKYQENRFNLNYSPSISQEVKEAILEFKENNQEIDINEKPVKIDKSSGQPYKQKILELKPLPFLEPGLVIIGVEVNIETGEAKYITRRENK